MIMTDVTRRQLQRAAELLRCATTDVDDAAYCIRMARIHCTIAEIVTGR